MNALHAMMLSALAFSFFPLFNAYGLALTSPILFALLNQTATIIVVVCLFFAITRKSGNGVPLIKAFFTLPTEQKLIAFFSGVSVYLGGVFFLLALSLMSKASATLIMELRPLIAMFIAPIMMIEKTWAHITRIDFLLILLTLTGLLMLTASETNMDLMQFIQNPFAMFEDQSAYVYVGSIMAFLSAFCFAFSGVSRAHFAGRLSQDFRIKYFKKTGSITESVYAYMMAYLLGFPLSILLLLFLETDTYISVHSFIPALMNGFALVGTSVFFSYAIINAKNSNVNLVLYLSTLFATLWLYLAGFSDITCMLIIGGGLIIIANIVLYIRQRAKR